MISVFIVYPKYVIATTTYRKTFCTTYTFYTNYHHPRNVERASSATSSRYDRYHEKRIEGGTMNMNTRSARKSAVIRPNE